MKFCFLCDKETEILIEGYCEECYNKKFKLIQVPEKISFQVCDKCNRIKQRNQWKDIEIDELLRDKIKILGENVGIKIEKNDVLHLTVKGSLKESKEIKEEKYDIILKPSKAVCIHCSRKSGGYYETTIQLRGEIESVMEFVNDKMIEENQTYRLEEVKNGVDIYFVDKHFANRLAGALKKKFNAKIKKTSKLITRKEGKDIYRNVLLIRI